MSTSKNTLLLPFFVGVFLTGCQSMPFSESINDLGSVFGSSEDTEITVAPEANEPNKERELSEQLVKFIVTANQGEIARIEQSPWSSNHDIMAMENYYSATGRKCRTLRLLHSIEGLPRKQFVCEDDDGEWVPIRCITR